MGRIKIVHVPIEYGLKDKVSIFEYHDKTILWIINADYRAVELAYKDKMIRVSIEVKNYIKERKSMNRIKAEVYHVDDRIMKAYYSNSRRYF